MHKQVRENYKNLRKTDPKTAAAVRKQASTTAALACHAFVASYYDYVGKKTLADKVRADSPMSKPCPLAHAISGSNATLYLDVAIVPRDYVPTFHMPPIPKESEEEFRRVLLHNVSVIRSLQFVYAADWLPKGLSFVASADNARIELSVDGRILPPEEFPNSLGVVHFYKIGEELFFPSETESK